MLNDVLFELGTEELPSGAVWPLADTLANLIIARLAKEGIGHGDVHRFATPRRIAVKIDAVEEKQASQTVSRRGPSCAGTLDASGNPTQALLGFAKSCGVSLDELSTLKTDKGEWWFYEALVPGLNTVELLPTIINEALAALPIAKSMRWGNKDIAFARPVHWAVLLVGESVISAEILGVISGRHSVGHRFHHPQAIEITSPNTYESQLLEAYVVADFSKRRQQIADQINALTTEKNICAIMPEQLLDEVTSIVEWPQALLANFETEFLDVPAEALIAAMQLHQKCFALQDKNGELLPHFITVANIESKNPAQVIVGNEKVMRARLSDAAFFYQKDKNQPLCDYITATSSVVFQAGLGSLQDKANRLQKLVDYLVEPLKLDKAQASRSAVLSKCDLMTGMVGEFPELQGLMGYYYALNDGEEMPVAQALNEQYLPRFAYDTLPQTNLGLALSLADRMDTLVGNFAIGQKPTGMKDPFKLRRHALAIVRMLISIPVALNLADLIEKTLSIYGDSITQKENGIDQLHAFILERLQSYYQNKGIAANVVNAVRARQNQILFDIDKRIHALLDFVNLPEAERLSAACKRVNNILQQAGSPVDTLVDKALLIDTAEQTLFNHIQRVEEHVVSLYDSAEYGLILNQLAQLSESVDAFFEHVMVMVDDAAIKANRLRLLVRLQSLLQGVADISHLS